MQNIISILDIAAMLHFTNIIFLIEMPIFKTPFIHKVFKKG